jgi:hypothetical protein
VSYISDETGRPEVYIRPFKDSPEPGQASGRWIISKDGGQGIPKWRDDGKELVYADLTGMVWAVALDIGTSVQARAPRPLFQIPPGATGFTNTVDLKKFLVPMPVEQKVPQAFTVMLNWTSLLKSR